MWLMHDARRINYAPFCESRGDADMRWQVLEILLCIFIVTINPFLCCAIRVGGQTIFSSVFVLLRVTMETHCFSARRL